MGKQGQRNPHEYRRIIAEVFYDSALRKIGVRPCPGQGIPIDLKIEFSKAIRSYPLGTKIRLDVVETDREGGRPYLYSSYKWEHEVVNENGMAG